MELHPEAVELDASETPSARRRREPQIARCAEFVALVESYAGAAQRAPPGGWDAAARAGEAIFGARRARACPIPPTSTARAPPRATPTSPHPDDAWWRCTELVAQRAHTAVMRG